MKTSVLIRIIAAVGVPVVCVLAVGCSRRQQSAAPSHPPNPAKVVFSADPRNPSNLLVTISFRNPVPTSEESVTITFYSATLQRHVGGGQTNESIPIATGPMHGVSVCTFSIPANDVTNCSVYLIGVDSKPVGEATVAWKVELGGPARVGGE